MNLTNIKQLKTFSKQCNKCFHCLMDFLKDIKCFKDNICICEKNLKCRSTWLVVQNILRSYVFLNSPFE